MDKDFLAIFNAIKADGANADYTKRGIDPLYSVGAGARIVIIGQAPGAVAEETRIPWNDKSGERLRDWLGVSRETFYDPERVALLPMDFYFPGHGRSGDLPPRKGFAEQRHPALLALMPNVRLTVLVGAYAVRRYLHLKNSDSLTTVVRDYDAYIGRGFFPLVHPSPRNQLWMSRSRPRPCLHSRHRSTRRLNRGKWYEIICDDNFQPYKEVHSCREGRWGLVRRLKASSKMPRRQGGESVRE